MEFLFAYRAAIFAAAAVMLLALVALRIVKKQAANDYRRQEKLTDSLRSEVKQLKMQKEQYEKQLQVKESELGEMREKTRVFENITTLQPLAANEQVPISDSSAWRWEVRPSILKSALEIPPENIAFSNDSVSAVFKGSAKTAYQTDLESCDCTFFRMRKNRAEACKHMIRLAIESGILDGQGRPYRASTADNRKMGDGRFQIVRELGTISTSETGWQMEMNLVAWNGGAPKIDIRTWSPDRKKLSKGITLSDREGRRTLELLFDYFAPNRD